MAGKKEEKVTWTEAQVMVSLKEGLAAGQAPAGLARKVASDSGWPRRDLYKLVTDLQKEE